MAQAQRRDKGALLQLVYAKIEKEFKTDKTFSHWDFEDCLGADKTRDRNRISVRFRFLWKVGTLKCVRETARSGDQRKYGVYQAVELPIKAKKEEYRAPFGLVPNTDLDNIFFNLGKKRHEKVNLQLLGRTNGRPLQTHPRGKAPASVNANVHRANPD